MQIERIGGEYFFWPCLFFRQSAWSIKFRLEKEVFLLHIDFDNKRIHTYQSAAIMPGSVDDSEIDNLMKSRSRRPWQKGKRMGRHHMKLQTFWPWPLQDQQQIREALDARSKLEEVERTPGVKGTLADLSNNEGNFAWTSWRGWGSWRAQGSWAARRTICPDPEKLSVLKSNLCKIWIFQKNKKNVKPHFSQVGRIMEIIRGFAQYRKYWLYSKLPCFQSFR